MKSFSFGIFFRFDTDEYYETTFDLSLYDEEIAFVETWLKENDNQPFWAFEYENEPLFKRMMDAHIKAILAYINKHVVTRGEEPFTEENVDWEYVDAVFVWPDKLLKS